MAGLQISVLEQPLAATNASSSPHERRTPFRARRRFFIALIVIASFIYVIIARSLSAQSTALRRPLRTQSGYSQYSQEMYFYQRLIEGEGAYTSRHRMM